MMQWWMDYVSYLSVGKLRGNYNHTQYTKSYNIKKMEINQLTLSTPFGKGLLCPNKEHNDWNSSKRKSFE